MIRPLQRGCPRVSRNRLRLFHCRSFTSSDNENLVEHDSMISAHSLGLFPDFVLPTLWSIRQLPEVMSALDEDSNTSSKLESLERAINVFEMMNRGGPEHCAVLALLAQHQQSLASYEDSFRILDLLEGFTDERSRNIVRLAKAKVQWYNGDFSGSFSQSEQVANEEHDDTLFQACALNSIGLSHLLKLEDGDISEADTAREILRVGCKSAENGFLESPLSVDLGLASAAFYGNLGVAQAVYSCFLESKVTDVPIPRDAALMAGRDGLNILERVESSPELSRSQQLVVELIRARLYSNMSWSLLEGGEDERLMNASEYARNALTIYEKHKGMPGNELKACLGRSLSIVAKCYNKADSAVTAEGLYQSAVQSLLSGVGPLERISLRDAYRGYAALCHNWDKRDGDALRLETQGNETEELLPVGWKGKTGIHVGLSFALPADFCKN